MNNEIFLSARRFGKTNWSHLLFKQILIQAVIQILKKRLNKLN